VIDVLMPYVSTDLMWSDPDDVENWGVSPRGAGWLFGASVTQEVCPLVLHRPAPISFDGFEQFNHVNSLSLIARAHQLVQEGYKYMFDEALATVWSAPNYCYRCGNMAAILTVREDGTRGFTVFGPAEENERDTEQQRTRRAVCSLFNRSRHFEMLMRCFLKGKFTIFRVDHHGRCGIDSSIFPILWSNYFDRLFHCM